MIIRRPIVTCSDFHIRTLKRLHIEKKNFSYWSTGSWGLLFSVGEHVPINLSIISFGPPCSCFPVQVFIMYITLIN